MTEKPEQHNIAGIVLVSAGVGFLATMDSAAKWLVGADYSVLQILALRGWIITFALLMLLPRLGGLSALKTKRPGVHLIRVIVGFFAPFLFFTSLKTMPLADTTVVFFGGATFLMTALSVPLFKERVGPHRWGAIIVGFVGVLIAARPGDGVFQIEVLYALGSGASYALMALATRWLGPREGVFRQVFYFNFSMALVGGLALPFVFVPMPMTDSGILLVMAVLALAGHYCLTRAFSLAPVGLLAPFEYSSLIWAALLGFVIWGDVPASSVITGGGIIIASGLYLAHREARAARARKNADQEAIVVVDPVALVVALDSDQARPD